MIKSSSKFKLKNVSVIRGSETLRGSPQEILMGTGKGQGYMQNIGNGCGNVGPLPSPPHCHPYETQTFDVSKGSVKMVFFKEQC